MPEFCEWTHKWLCIMSLWGLGVFPWYMSSPEFLSLVIFHLPVHSAVAVLSVDSHNAATKWDHHGKPNPRYWGLVRLSGDVQSADFCANCMWRQRSAKLSLLPSGEPGHESVKGVNCHKLYLDMCPLVNKRDRWHSWGHSHAHKCVATALDLVGKWFIWKIPANQEMQPDDKQEHEGCKS